ncbi:hypothetical protein AURDEDRAFT_164460 [Auricularia subglabra TFB-10046 SS5]|nr:hypothetical protein AURDEDRAFT_164460 [Auricularia subglabra TFB-10046 SS5]
MSHALQYSANDLVQLSSPVSPRGAGPLTDTTYANDAQADTSDDLACPASADMPATLATELLRASNPDAPSTPAPDSSQFGNWFYGYQPFEASAAPKWHELQYEFVLAEMRSKMVSAQVALKGKLSSAFTNHTLTMRLAALFLTATLAMLAVMHKMDTITSRGGLAQRSVCLNYIGVETSYIEAAVRVRRDSDAGHTPIAVMLVAITAPASSKSSTMIRKNEVKAHIDGRDAVGLFLGTHLLENAAVRVRRDSDAGHTPIAVMFVEILVDGGT